MFASVVSIVNWICGGTKERNQETQFFFPLLRTKIQL